MIRMIVFAILAFGAAYCAAAVVFGPKRKRADDDPLHCIQGNQDYPIFPRPITDGVISTRPMHPLSDDECAVMRMARKDAA